MNRRDDQQARPDRREIKRAHRGLGDQRIDDEGDAGRNKVAERAARRERAEHHLVVVARAVKERQRDRAHGGGGRDRGTGDRREYAAGRDVGVQEPAGQPVEPDIERAIEPLGQPGAQQYLAHQQKQRHRDQHEARRRRPHGLAEEIPERAVGERKADDQSEHAERGGDIDAGAEEQAEQPDQQQAFPDQHIARPRAGEAEHDGQADQHQQEQDRDHGLPSFAPECAQPRRSPRALRRPPPDRCACAPAPRPRAPSPRSPAAGSRPAAARSARRTPRCRRPTAPAGSTAACAAR